MKKLLAILLVATTLLLTGCEEISESGAKQDLNKQQEITDKLTIAQPTPTDISYSLERHNLIKRAYWINGEKEKANSVVAPMPLPVGNIILISHGRVIGQYNVSGKVSSLESYLTPTMVQSRYYDTTIEKEIPDVDGSFGKNAAGIFFFTTEGNYIEWAGEYIYSDILLNTQESVVVR